jgi:hypothetical protein
MSPLQTFAYLSPVLQVAIYFLKLCGFLCVQVNWKTLLSALVGDTVDLHDTVQLYFEGYFDSLFDKLGDLFRTHNMNR